MENIIVGVDGSASAADALRWAFRESRLREATVTALLAWDLLGQHHADGSTTFDPKFGEPEAVAALDAFVINAVGNDSVHLVTQQVTFGLPADTLLEAAQTASMLVLGARGHGGFRELLLGSVSQRCLHLAECNVAIVRTGTDHETSTAGRIVVGIDGSAHGQAALDWAVHEATLRHAALRVVHACAPNFSEVAFLPNPVTSADIANKQAQALLEHALAATGGVAHLDIELMPTSGSPAKALLEASTDADLIVVGRTGRTLLRGLAMGSVATQISHHAHIPAVFVSSNDNQQVEPTVR